MRVFTRRQCPPLVVVLGGGINPDGTPADETLFRATAAAELVHAQPRIQTLIVSGKGPLTRLSTISEAQVMSDVLASKGIDRSLMHLEDESVDTLGNAVLVSARYLSRMKPTTIYLVTSPFHMQRALLIFHLTLGAGWKIIPYACRPLPNDRERAQNEVGGIAWTLRFFTGINPGDLSRIIERFQSEKPYYASLPWLIAASFHKKPMHHRWWHRFLPFTR
jgi:uncharacterized SAM-binding protein YcdF (DUF218 family)